MIGQHIFYKIYFCLKQLINLFSFVLHYGHVGKVVDATVINLFILSLSYFGSIENGYVGVL